MGKLRAFRALTTWRRSGQPHRVRLWFHVEGGSLWVVSSLDLESSWTRHILREPRVEALVGGRGAAYRVRAVAVLRPERPLLGSVARAIFRKYHGWLDEEAVADWCRRAALVELRPLDVEPAGTEHPAGADPA